MPRIHRHFPAGWLLLPFLIHPGPAAVAAAAPAGADDDRMAAIVAALREEEAKYRDIEYVARIVIRDSTRKGPDDRAEVTTQATRRVILQGDRSYIRYQAFERMPGTKFRWEMVSAYDGERTRTVTAGNCANIHLGRFIHPDISPAHGLPLAHYKINFPLSVYLSGTDAIRATFKYPPDLVASGSTDVFAKVVVHFEGEERIDGLRCLKIRVDRWYRTYEQSFTQYLWLAPERSYHCVKERYLGLGNRVLHDMSVADLRELAPGAWFPMRITVTEYEGGQQPPPNQGVATRTATIDLKVELAPHYEAALFRDIPIPADLPTFLIKERTLVGSTMPESADGEGAPKKLRELAAGVAKQERRYDDIEVKAHVRYKVPNPRSARWAPVAEEVWDDRSIIRGELAYHTSNRMQASESGPRRATYQADAFDGHWSRKLWGSDPQDHPQGLGVILHRGGVKIDEGLRDGIFVYRPHNLVLRDMGIFGSLADLLASGRADRTGQTTLQFRYCGTADVDGHPCIKVHGDFISNQQIQRDALVLYLATDRNDIPIKLEFYPDHRVNRLMPTDVYRCDDFREIAPGLWYPFRLIELGLEVGAHMGQAWVLLNWKRDYTIDSVTRAPKLDDAVFRDVIAPAGAQVQVQDEDGSRVGVFQQAETGIPSITPARYLELLSGAPVDALEQQARQRAIDALIEKPAPEFPEGAQWHNGKPLTWQALRGRVVILEFWAEWSDHCRDDLAELERLHQGRDTNGLTIIGVHPPGSEPDAIKKVMRELHLDYPMCIDVPPREGDKAWGDLFGRFAVKSIPHAVAIDDKGTIVARGKFQDVLAKARGLGRKGE